MGEMDEDRVYDDRRRETVAYLATGQGVATVRVASDRVGRFSLTHQCTARDIAAAGERVYVATPEGVLAGGVGTDAETAGAVPGEFDSLEFPDAVTVTAAATDDGEPSVVAAGADGTVARYRDDAWHELGAVGEVRALSGEFVAASDGVYQLVGDEGDATLRHVGLDDARDVTGGAAPLVATGEGLYRLGNGWLCEREGAFAVVATGDTAGGSCAHAATDETLYARRDGEWTAVDLPVPGTVADVAYGECVYAVTGDGTFLVEADPERTADGAGGWRHRSLGLPDVAALAAV
ncbi:MAG: hypothetical protein V5A44_05245 [Haloarculaceae archaeon]